jgi:phosphate transport system substrate-binding protein
MRRYRHRQWAVFPVVAALALGACGGGGAGDGGGTAGGLSGEIAIDGSRTSYPFAQAAAEMFQTDNPDVEVIVGRSGTGRAFELLCAGDTDIASAPRSIDAETYARACAKRGVAYEDVEVVSGVHMYASEDARKRPEVSALMEFVAENAPTIAKAAARR